MVQFQCPGASEADVPFRVRPDGHAPVLLHVDKPEDKLSELPSHDLVAGLRCPAQTRSQTRIHPPHIPIPCLLVSEIHYMVYTQTRSQTRIHPPHIPIPCLLVSEIHYMVYAQTRS